MVPELGIRESRLSERDSWAVQRFRMSSGTARGQLSDMLLRMGIEAARPPTYTGTLSLPLKRARAGSALFHEGAPAESVHVVQSGSFKCLKTSEDGYEQVLAFASPGDVLGFEALCAGRQPASAVALEDSSVYALPLPELDQWRRHVPELDRALQIALSRQLAHATAMVEMMAAVAAEVRLARFLVWLSGRMEERGQSPRRLLLRMSRRDIASLLGVAHETVSRSFGALAEGGHLRVEHREVEILDLERLKACTRNTRGLVEDASRGPKGRKASVTREIRPLVHSIAAS